MVRKFFGFLILLPVLAVFFYGFTHFKTLDILIPAMIASIGGFVVLGAIWLVRYAGKEVNRS